MIITRWTIGNALSGAWSMRNRVLTVLILFITSSDSLQSKHTFTPHSTKNPIVSAPHSFWRKERTAMEIEMHVYACLAGIHDHFETASSAKASLDSGNERAAPLSPLVAVEVLSAEPPLVVVHDFLSSTMCDDLIQTAMDTEELQRSRMGVHQEIHNARTSSTVWLTDDQTQATGRLIAEKVSSITGLPTSHMENLQVARYRKGQEFKVHTDHQNSFNDLECRGRLATCLIYLSAPASGGETWFPELEWGLNLQDSVADKPPRMDPSTTDTTAATTRRSAIEDAEIRIAPIRGSAVFFWNTVERPGISDYSPNMYLHADLRMKHAGLPVEDGIKWICNRWIHPVNFGAGVRGM